MDGGEKYKLIFEGSPDAILIIDPEKKIYDCNTRTEELFGISKTTLIGSDFEYIFQEKIHSWYQFSELYTQILSGNAPQPFELETKTRKGIQDWFKIFSNVLIQPDHTPFIQLNIRKITARKHEEEKLRIENKDYLFLAQASSELSEMKNEEEVFSYIGHHLPFILPQSILFLTKTSRDGSVLQINQVVGIEEEIKIHLEKIIGKELDQIHFRNIDFLKIQFSKPKLLELNELLLDSLELDIPKENLGLILQTLEVKNIYTIGIANQGLYYGFIHILNKQPGIVLNQSLLESFVHLSYLTIARIKTMKDLEDREKQYLLLADNIKDVIFTTDMNLNYTYISPSIRTLRGYDPWDLIGKPVYTILVPESYEEVKNHFLKELEYGKQNGFDNRRELSLELELIHLNGQKIWWEVKVTFILDENRRPTGILGITREISERKKNASELLEMNKELQEANAQKNKFFSILAHDLKNPFGHILNFSSLLTDHYELYSEDKRKSFIGLINKSTQQIYELLENLLDWARSQGGKMEFFPQVINLDKMITNIFDLFDNQAKLKKITLSKYTPNSIHLEADEYMLKTVLRNLIGNAIKFSYEGGTVNLKVVAYDHKLILTVSDHGTGIDPAVSETLFNLSNNMSHPGTKGEKGTGLGLLLCKEFVELHRGLIRVESSPGKGSTFTIELPLKQNIISPPVM